MVKWFTDVTNNAGTGEKSAIRSLQAWQYLVSKASNRQIVTYEELRLLMEYQDSRPLSHILGNIMFYCQQNELPPLTIIVVSKSGIPGEGFTAADLDAYHQKREDVFNYPWLKMIPPSIDDYSSARANA